ncbi:type II secretion system GspH family protein [Marinobacter bryozoorum]|uniref:PulJ/GspJ family protein n=1 Tax=Marinobacter bryozoorum TaxID=256324 RepID=UPI002002E62A|nr:type II secretion system protein [Marinobacter bryozoorum]MCK7544290.1 type II secretion system GspH family protein [Marinobacter bryozoorum]
MRRARGFTLVELVMVIVLLSIVATISVQFVAMSTRGALELSARQKRALQGVVVSEQLSRDLRSAFAFSVRANGNCIEWLPIAGATLYRSLTRPPDQDDIDIVPVATLSPVVSPLRAIVYGYGTGQSALYGSSDPGPVSPPVDGSFGAGDDTVPLTAGHRFAQRSPERRLYLIGQPVSVCQQGDRLIRYEDYGRNLSQPAPPVGGDSAVLAANLELSSANFTVEQATFQRAAVVKFSFTLEDGDGGTGETTTFSQEVQIRNAP